MTAATMAVARESRADLRVRIGSLVLSNPIMPASGCFGPELASLMPCHELGAAVTKTVFAEMRGGNGAHRLSETPAGMVNSVGIPSLGPRGYLEHLHPAYRALGTPVIVSVGGHRTSDYAPVVAELADAGDAYEINVSCPNLDADGRDIGSDPAAITEVITQTRQETDRPLIVKLPPMVPSIADCAAAAEAAGADAVCVSNSLPALPLDERTRRPILGNVVGGLTGPLIKPIVQRLVWQAARAVDVPVVACGGVMTADDALDYISLGARAVQVGTATFSRPTAMVDIVRELRSRVTARGAARLEELARH
ncbi:dihydroorotate dehydrogenase [Microbacterium resistens]|uniref:dihydroorotate dehydrogenase n=1 Tax=Microbacterium resistens TaxID=156977 RepID=UPI000A6CAECC|nr:dihydroorotate dehydrogenase [Microbacterium resistens]MBW1638693.1 dihydroorotate dehydrogenase [Microbacterium resistens]